MTNSKKPRMDWALITSVVSSSAAVVAIIIGIYQYRNTIERTDLQIQYIKDAAQQKTEENRPLITIPKTYASPLKDYWQYKLEIQNIGVRHGYNLSIKSIILSVSDDFQNCDLSDTGTFNIVNPIAKEVTVNYWGNIYLKRFSKYYIRTQLNYLDILGGKTYNDTFYFRWEKLQDKDFDLHSLYAIGVEDKTRLNNLIAKEYPKFN